MQYYWEQPRPRQAPNRYSPDCLTGNWFERRLDDIIDKRAIVPSITGTSDCVDHKSTYQDEFQQRPPVDPVVEVQIEAFRLATAGKSGSIFLNDGDMFMNNFTTTTDISYRIIPKMYRANQAKLVEPEEKYDYYGHYGNATKTGLRAWLKCEKRKLPRVDLTVMKNDFVPLPIRPVVIVKGKK